MDKTLKMSMVAGIPISGTKRKAKYKAFWAEIRKLESEGWTLISYSAAFHYRAELERLETTKLEGVEGNGRD
ncbi:hypothetical protein HCJ39_13240 [Listeria rocourtiae]|uniref:hypothetical protein n=1 Tax=Listeria rocourtiae TaxID=647910 RepID=UPI001626A531|nr:hypothetical protein [Listeria rocourtiae]MBC1605679.1 hypothetical protein [Listeria rocourtiae]